MITTLALVGFPGQLFVEDISLSNVIILRICREGTGYNTKLTSSPGNREAGYVSSGRVYFNNAFSGDPAVSTDIKETVYIRFKY